MEPTTQNNTLRSLLIFIIIGAVLLAAVILGVRWARGRSDQLASASNQQQTEQPATTGANQQPAQQQQPAQTQPQQQAPATQPPQNNNTNNQVASNPTLPAKSSTSTQPTSNQPVPAQVPSTGIQDAFLPIATIAAVVFASATYLQSRRRLAPAK